MVSGACGTSATLDYPLTTLLSRLAQTIKPTVLFAGAGPGGFAGAADASRSGTVDVGVYAPPSHTAKLQQVRQRGQLLSKGNVISGCFTPRLFTDWSSAIRGGVDLVVNMLPAAGHEHLLQCLQQSSSLTKSPPRPLAVLMIAGVFSSPYVKRACPHLKVLESPTLPYVTRWDGHASINVYDAKARYIIGSSSPLTTDERHFVESLFPSITVEWQRDALQANLKAVNPIIHTAPLLLAYDDIIAADGHLYFYSQLMARDDVAATIEAMSAEMVLLQRACGYPEDEIESTLDVLNNNYATRFASIQQFAAHSIPHNAEYMCPTPASLPHHRYLTQDAKFGLVFLCELATLLDVSAPTLNRMVDLASLRLGEDIRKTGRTLSSVGLANASKREVFETFGCSLVNHSPDPRASKHVGGGGLQSWQVVRQETLPRLVSPFNSA